jgi:hypothetical protein
VTNTHTLCLAADAHLLDDAPSDAAAVEDIAHNLLRNCGSVIEKAYAASERADRVQKWRKLFEEVRPIGSDPVDAWRLFVYHPCLIIERFPALLNVRTAYRWRALTEMYEAWFRMAADGDVPGVDEQDAAQAIGRLSRTRWLLLSAPFRADPPVNLGRDAADAAQARHAREHWAGVLTAIEDYPELAADIDVEAAALKLTEADLGEAKNPDRHRRAVTDHVVTRLLLPRFAWQAALRCTLRSRGWQVWAHLAGAGTLFLAALAAFLAGTFTHWTRAYTIASIGAIAGYAVIAAGAAYRRPLGWLWLLRQPASAAVGLLTLAALPADWWWSSAPGTTPRATVVQATVALTIIGAGYLAIEVAGHGVRGWKIAWRSLGVSAGGLMHAFLVSLVGLRWIVPAFAAAPQNAPRLSCWWTATGCGSNALAPWLIVLAATAWSFVAGVFLQILWDDQPITAPLTHVTWRHGD